MRKEVVFAIILGLTLGLILAFGVYRANKATNTDVTASNNTNPTPTPTLAASNSGTLNLVNPQDGQIFNSPIATVTGSTKAGNMITIISENDELFVKPNADGSFEAEVKLDNGVNNLRVSTFTPTGDRQDVNLKVVYTTAVKVDENQ